MEGDANGGEGMGFSMHHLTKPPDSKDDSIQLPATEFLAKKHGKHRVQLKRQKVVDTTGQQRITLWYAGAQKLLITSLNVARAG
jgi:hypothetical protein